jgi:cyclopropane fatty-acyl-phospholipid synthase-like methyltransferase
MKLDFTLKDVQDVYDGPGGLLWEMCMTEQIHSGGAATTDVLANALGLKSGQHVLDICSALGAPARHIAAKYGVKVTGLDMTRTMLKKAQERTEAAKLTHLIDYVEGNALDLPFKKETFDVVWGQEAWCYITDKQRMMNEAYRVARPGARIGFTDWVITGKISDEELKPLLESMAFPDMATLQGWPEMMKKAGFKVLETKDETEEYARCFDGYAKIVADGKDTIVKNFGPDLFKFAENLVAMWRKAAYEHKVGRGFYIGQK